MASEPARERAWVVGWMERDKGRKRELALALSVFGCGYKATADITNVKAAAGKLTIECESIHL